MAEPDPDLVHTLAERLRPFTVRLGPNTVESIGRGMRDLQLSGGERHRLAEELAVLVDELAEHRRHAVAGPGHHVLVTVDEERNHGRASITRRMVPIWSPAGLLRAGDPVSVIREEFDLTESEAAVIVALTEDFTDLAAGDNYEDDDEPPPPELTPCRLERVVVDGEEQMVRVHGDEPMDDLDRAALTELVSASRAYAAANDEHMGVRQELAGAWMAAARSMPESAEKTRLRAAVKAALQALGAHRDRAGGGTDG